MSTDRTGTARRTLLALVVITLAGCGGSPPPPRPDGRSEFSLDDDEIDPRTLSKSAGKKPRGGSK